MSNTLDVNSLIQNRDPLSTWDSANQLWKKIPIALTPVEVSQSDWQSIQRDAETVASCFPILHDWLLRPENKDLHSKIYAGLDGIESDAANQPAKNNWGHATWRFDLYWDQADLKIIEANCTIPAMQAYSDILSELWQNASTQKLPFHNNTHDLLQNILELYRASGGSAKSPKVALLHRDQDSQISELNHYKKSWSKQFQVDLVMPDQLTISDSKLTSENTAFDIVYRHIFAWRLEKHSNLLLALKNNKTFHIYNPISAHFESKAFLAFLSEAADNIEHCHGFNLTKNQINAVKRSVPWTRVIFNEKKHSYWSTVSGKDQFLSFPEKFVIKSSIGYGGHQVLLGEMWSDPQNQQKLQKLMGSNQTITPHIFWDWLENTNLDTWIIQKKLSGRRHQTQFLDASNHLTEINGYVDASVFLSTGNKIKAGGGVSRIASGPVVNIGTGGGLAPFVVRPN